MKIASRLIVATACSTLAVPAALVPAATAGAAGGGAAGDTLLSAGRQATASSVRSSSLAPRYAVDGRSGTRWAGAAGTGPQWIQVDLGAVRAITRVTLSWSSAYATGYRLQTSTDGGAWTAIHTTASGNGGTDNLTGLTGRGRFVRLAATRPGSKQGYSLREFKVYGATIVAPAPARPVPTRPDVPAPGGSAGLSDPAKKEIAMRLISSAENSSLNWRGQFGYLEDIGDGRGYTGGIVGFCSGTGDMLELVERHTARVPGNVLAKYLPALRGVDNSASHAGLDPGYPADWRAAAQDPAFQQAQEDERDRVYFGPAVARAKADGLRALGQFAYYDAIVMHGAGSADPGGDAASFHGIRRHALRTAKTPAQGGDETAYLNAFLDARAAAMRTEEAHSDTSRVDTAQRVFLDAGNLDLRPPLNWKVYGEAFSISG